jgi:hypothetical protein
MFITKNVKQKNRVMPSSTGMVVMMFALMKVSDVIIKNDDNTDSNIRISTEEDILEHEYRIKNGLYNPEEFVPPTVNENGKLITGRHRYESHKGLDKEYIEVCVIKFVKTKDENNELQDEKHWEIHWQNIENLTKPKEHKRMASEQDVAFSVLKMIKNKSLLLNKNNIESYLKSLKLTPNKIKNIIKEVYSRSNKQEDIPLQYKAEDIKKEVNKNKNIIFSTPKNIELSSNDSVHFVQTFKKTQADEKHKQLIFDAMLNSLNKNPNEIVLHYSANTIDYKVVSKLEKNVEKYFYQYVNKIKKQVKMLDKINIKERVKFNPMNQKKIS